VTGTVDPAVAARLAELHRALAEEYEKLAGDATETSGTGLASLGGGEAECRTDAMPAEKPSLLTAAQLAAELQVDPRTLRRMRAAGEGPKPVTVRGRDRWRREAVDRWLARRQGS